MMRRGFLVAAVAAGMVLGCKSGPGPKAAAEAWLKAMEQCEVQGIKAGLTKSSLDQLEQLNRQFSAFVPPDQAKGFDLFRELCKSFRAKGVTVDRDEVDGDNATVYLKADKREQKAPMRREDGAWKLDLAAVLKTPGLTPGGVTPLQAPAGPQPGTTSTYQEPGPRPNVAQPEVGPSAVPPRDNAAATGTPGGVGAPGSAPIVNPGTPNPTPPAPVEPPPGTMKPLPDGTIPAMPPTIPGEGPEGAKGKTPPVPAGK